MSLIADSLKKAIKEKSAPKWEASRETNPVAGNRELEKRPRLPTVFRIILLVILPAAVLAYLISIDAFSFKKTSVTQKPDLPAAVPVEEARVAPPSKPAPVAPPEKSVAVSSPRPTKKTSVEKETAALKTPDKPPAGKKEKTGVKRIVPSSVPEKKSSQPKKAIISVPAAPDEKAVALSSPESKPPSPVAAEIPPSATEKKTSAVISKETPALNQPEVEIPDHEIAMPPAPPAKSSVEPVLEKTEVSPEQETAHAVAEKKTSTVVSEETHALNQPEVEIPDHEIAMPPAPPVQSSVEPALEKAEVSAEQETAEKPEAPAKPSVEPALEKAEVSPEQETAPAFSEKKTDAVVSKETPALNQSEVEILDHEIAARQEPPAKSSEEPVFKKGPSSPAVQENPEVASLPAPSLKPEISRIDPKDQENVFNSSDYYFNRGIFFQQAGDWEKALVNYSKSEELEPNNPDTYNNKGVVLKEMGEYDNALDEFLRAVFLDAGYAKAYNNIGVVYYMQKNYPEAIKHYLKAIDINPTNLEAFNNLAIIYKKQKESDKARGILNRALSLDPDHPGTNYNLAVLYEENREIKPALHFYRRFIDLGARNYPSLVLQVKEHLEGMKPQ